MIKFLSRHRPNAMYSEQIFIRYLILTVISLMHYLLDAARLQKLTNLLNHFFPKPCYIFQLVSNSNLFVIIFYLGYSIYVGEMLTVPLGVVVHLHFCQELYDTVVDLEVVAAYGQFCFSTALRSRGSFSQLYLFCLQFHTWFQCFLFNMILFLRGCSKVAFFGQFIILILAFHLLRLLGLRIIIIFVQLVFFNSSLLDFMALIFLLRNLFVYFMYLRLQFYILIFLLILLGFISLSFSLLLYDFSVRLIFLLPLSIYYEIRFDLILDSVLIMNRAAV